MRRQIALASTLSLLASAATWLGAGTPSAIASPSPPSPTYSFYMGTTDQTTLYNLGLSFGGLVAAGKRPQDSVVILDWGDAYCTSTTCGTLLETTGSPFASTLAEREASQQFAYGFWKGTGADTSAFMDLSMGTTNHGSWFSNSSNSYHNAYFHGWNWANMITDANTWLQTNGYSSQVEMRAGIDAELDWSNFSAANAWANGYLSKWTSYYYDYGDAAGCPPYGGCDNGWSQYDVWDMSWGVTPAEPIPEIYNNANAQEWGQIADYSWDSQTMNMHFYGSMSQYQACLDTNNACTGVDDTPNQSWTQLYDNLNCSTDCPTPQTPQWSTDIRWKLYA